MNLSARIARPAVAKASVALGVLLAATLCATAMHAAPAGANKTEAEAETDPARPDVQLTAVSFVDPQTGWAVGDRGTILHTSDGGQHWQPQTSGTRARLASVQFLDRKIGWAAGGSTEPYTRASKAVVLQTRDGGLHWYHDDKILLPQVRRIRFFDSAHGWAVAVPSALFPSGVFISDDGGRTWMALPATSDRSWTTGDFSSRENGALAGSQRALGSVRHRELAEQAPIEPGLGAWRRMTLDSSGHGWLAGDGGALVETKDSGRAWQPPRGKLPAGVGEQFDFCAVTAVGSSCWVAGTPGTRVFKTADGGATWTAQPTGQNLPIRDLAFADERHGWAVGDLGLILATEDGGQTWRTQQAAATRAALTAFYGDPAEVPFELLARLSGEEGFVGVVEILNRQDVEQRSSVAEQTPDFMHEAVVRAGASAAETAWGFPLREPGLNLKIEDILAAWSSGANSKDPAGDGAARLDEYLVRQIRVWRPAVIVTSAPGATDHRAGLINQLVLAAVQHAADRERCRDQIALAGLQPWRVEKVYGSLPTGELGTANLSTVQVAPRLGRSLSEAASPARGLVSTDYTLPPASIGFRLLIDHVPQGLGQRDFFSGVPLPAVGEARRALSEPPLEGIERMRRSAQTRRNLQAILTRAEQTAQNDARWLAEVGELTAAMDPTSAAEVLFQLGDRYHKSGRWDMAADAFGLLVERHPREPLTAAALVWLVQYYSSSEAAWRSRQHQQMTVRQVSSNQALDAAKSGDVKAAGGAAAALFSGQNAANADRRVRGPADDNRGERAARAIAFARLLEQSQPGVFAEPAVGFPLAVAQRATQQARQAERFVLGLRRYRPRDPWWSCAQGESWLADGQGAIPKPQCRCTRAAEKPTLDGQLDEPLWQQAPPLELHSIARVDSQWPAVAMLACDDEYLYIALSCRQAPGAEYPASKSPRQRDADLAARDRVEIYLDTDRDYATAYRLVIDHRGWTFEDCWRDKSWNPEWFVAVAQGEESWTAEAAIPLTELCAAAPRKQTWALGIQRIVPGVGFQSWTKPAAVRAMPEAFGYLSFE